MLLLLLLLLPLFDAAYGTAVLFWRMHGGGVVGMD